MEKAEFFSNENGNETAEGFYLLLDTVINETTYILASDVDPDIEEDCECFILKKVGENEEDAVYEPVEDEEEYTSVSKIFNELLDEDGVSLE